MVREQLESLHIVQVQGKLPSLIVCQRELTLLIEFKLFVGIDDSEVAWLEDCEPNQRRE